MSEYSKELGTLVFNPKERGGYIFMALGALVVGAILDGLAFEGIAESFGYEGIIQDNVELDPIAWGTAAASVFGAILGTKILTLSPSFAKRGVTGRL